MKSNLYKTTVVHERFQPFKHKFKYSILSMIIDYKELDTLSNKLKLFSYNKFNLFFFYDKDHGFRDNRTLFEFTEKYLKKNNFQFNDLSIKIVCFPRILGYAFNPLSIIYCYEQSKLVAIFYEVKNTSNEQHTYFFASNETKDAKEYKHECSKNFYVSPFIGMKGVYKFINYFSKNNISIIIDFYDENNKKILKASQFGTSTDLNSFTLFKQLIINPLVSLKVIVGILYEAFFLFYKGGKYYSRQKKIVDTVSYEGKL